MMRCSGSYKKVSKISKSDVTFPALRWTYTVEGCRCSEGADSFMGEGSLDALSHFRKKIIKKLNSM